MTERFDYIITRRSKNVLP